jgi:hypothetical protein
MQHGPVKVLIADRGIHRIFAFHSSEISYRKIEYLAPVPDILLPTRVNMARKIGATAG